MVAAKPGLAQHEVKHQVGVAVVVHVLLVVAGARSEADVRLAGPLEEHGGMVHRGRIERGRGQNGHSPNKLHELIKDDGWEIAVKVKEPGENVWLAYRSRETAIKEIYVVVLSDHELVLVRAEGDIDLLAVKAIRDHMPEHARIGRPLQLP